MVWLWLLCRPSASQRLWKVWRILKERKKGKGRVRARQRGGERSFEQQGMAALQRTTLRVRSLPVPYSLSVLSLYSSVFTQPFRTSQLWLTVYSFFLWIDPLPPPPYLSTLICQGWGCAEETKPLNIGLSFTQKVSRCIWGASWWCHMSRHSKSQGLRMWVIWSRGTKVCCWPKNGVFSYGHGEKRVNKHRCLGVALKCSAVFFSEPHLYKLVII